MWQRANPHDGFRSDAVPEDGGVPGSDPALLYEDVIDSNETDYEILNVAGVLIMGTLPKSDYAHELSRTFSQCLANEWLEYSNRFIGALTVTPQRPQKAVEQIPEFGDHPQIRQVIMGSVTKASLGRE
jgi:predicted TIM-barrel fold metal-dependent hydrolase